MEPKVSRLKLNIPKTRPLLSDFESELQQTVIPNGSVSLTAPVSNFHPHFLPRRYSVSIPRPENTSKLSQAFSRTFTLSLSSLMSSSMAVDEWKRIFDKLDLVSLTKNLTRGKRSMSNGARLKTCRFEYLPTLIKYLQSAPVYSYQ